MNEITLNWLCFRRIDIFVFFLSICSVESAPVLVLPNATNVDGQKISYLAIDI